LHQVLCVGTIWDPPAARHLASGTVAELPHPAEFPWRSGLILLDQVRTLDKVRLVRKLGAVPAATLSSTLKTLQLVLAR
jgi:mRNA-degrading endonuclease toxin of MazEF toxin-antitoxin module